MFENPDPELLIDLKKPALPEEYASLNKDEKPLVDDLHRRRMLYYLYYIFTGKINRDHLNLLRNPLLPLIQELVDRAGRPWSGNYVTLKSLLMKVTEYWTEIAGKDIQCPIRFSDAHVRDHMELDENWTQCNVLVKHWRNQMHYLGQDGWVRNEDFDSVVKMNQKLKLEWLGKGEDEEDRACVEEGWPFRDQNEDF